MIESGNFNCYSSIAVARYIYSQRSIYTSQSQGHLETLTGILVVSPDITPPDPEATVAVTIARLINFFQQKWLSELSWPLMVPGNNRFIVITTYVLARLTGIIYSAGKLRQLISTVQELEVIIPTHPTIQQFPAGRTVEFLRA